MSKELFNNRKEAGLLLARDLEHYRQQDAVVIAIPRGGIPIGYKVAEYLDLPLDVVIVKKLGHPLNKELAIGWVSLSDRVVDESFEVSQQYIDTESARLQEEIKTRYKQYRDISGPISVTGKQVILTDDGIATGNSMLAAIQLIRQAMPKRIILAVPVAPPTTIEKIEQHVEEVICLKTPPYFHAVGAYYQDFTQISDEEAIKLFKTAHERVKKADGN
jgi:predicted phosphoribosyltransferase